MQEASDAAAHIGLGAVFTLFVITLGPIKVLGPFSQLTRELDEPTLRQVAIRAFLLSVVTVVLGGYVGLALLENWKIPIAELELAGGLIFFMVGMRLVLEQYQPPAPPPPPLPPTPTAAALRLTFPTIVTPYGIAAVIVLLANSSSAERTLILLGILVAVMVLNLLFMLYARKLAGSLTLMALRILGAVLGVLQVALAVEMILRSLRGIGILHG
jgi:multiple antibiotic resistance protein